MRLLPFCPVRPIIKITSIKSLKKQTNKQGYQNNKPQNPIEMGE